MELRIEPRAIDHPDAVRLVEQVQDEYIVRYGYTDATPVETDEFTAPHGLFLVGYLADEPVACGGWRARIDDSPDREPGDAEMKRLYVASDARGRGYARRILVALERSALHAGKSRMVLETGTEQPEAVALYDSVGYSRIPAFGVHRCDPASVCLAKTLAPISAEVPDTSVPCH